MALSIADLRTRVDDGFRLRLRLRLRRGVSRRGTGCADAMALSVTDLWARVDNGFRLASLEFCRAAGESRAELAGVDGALRAWAAGDAWGTFDRTG